MFKSLSALKMMMFIDMAKQAYRNLQWKLINNIVVI